MFFWLSWFLAYISLLMRSESESLLGVQIKFQILRFLTLFHFSMEDTTCQDLRSSCEYLERQIQARSASMDLELNMGCWLGNTLFSFSQTLNCSFQVSEQVHLRHSRCWCWSADSADPRTKGRVPCGDAEGESEGPDDPLQVRAHRARRLSDRGEMRCA